MSGKLVVLAALLSVVPSSGFSTSTRIATGGDDTEQSPDGTVRDTSSDIELGKDTQYSNSPQTVGLRFTKCRRRIEP